mmetsp:Transcript_42266/g.64799  ORF Transcript_42266/g.64799 Transcript_42266/m.64799 type:complete len:97 (+) Transcript_42266:175-465(+)
MAQLESDTQYRLEGKIISYYNYNYKCFVYLGCTPEREQFGVTGKRPFDPKTVPDCVDALDMQRQIPLDEMVPSKDDLIVMGAPGEMAEILKEASKL